MRAFLKFVLVGCGALGVIILIGIVGSGSRSHNSSNPSYTSPTSTDGASTPTYEATSYSDGFNPRSDEVLIPYELSKNPYKWKGQSGILDTQRTAVVMPNGVAAPFAALGSIKFDKMLDEHTALYDVMTVDEVLVPNGQIAVILPNSDPPDLRKLWRVLVLGSLDGTNAFGGGVTISAVKFEEYYVPPPRPTQVEPAPTPQPEQGAVSASTERTGTWTPLSHTADAITGDVSLSGSAIAIAETSYPITTDHLLTAGETTSVAEAFSVPSNQSLDARLYRTDIPANATMRNGNKICGSGAALWIVSLTTAAGNAAPEQLNLLFLSGDSTPTLDSSTLASSGRLCGTYSYQRADVSEPHS